MTDLPRAKGSCSGLSGLPLRVWQVARGRTPVGDIARMLGCTPDQVWSALDLLDHVGLLEHPWLAGGFSDPAPRLASPRG